MIELDDELDLARETAKRPPDKWRPWWRSMRPFIGICTVCGERTGIDIAGQVFSTHCRFFPTKDVSDTYGTDQANDVSRYFGSGIVSFVCSLPDGESL